MPPSDIARRYATSYTRLRLTAVRRAEQLWRSLGGLTDAHAERYVPRAAVVSLGAEAAAARLVGGYLTTALRDAGEKSTVRIDPRELKIRDKRPDEVWFRPVAQTRYAISQGKPFAEAFELGRQRVMALAGTNVLLAQRAAVNEIADQDNRIRGYRRVLTGTCSLCDILADDLYSGELMPIHDNCACAVAPVIDRVDPAAALNTFAMRDNKPEDRGTDVKIHEHGELGPTVYDADHEFSDEPD